ncbi:hypothetical protein PAP_02265 [Palaeococcus pacificus DY20341]|uniref:DUF4013 domain-containing protein n=2 Tax=Palaeococcus TaxID=83867 RepID=A0A075LQA7_9EURY|nr:hypothetical protein PAP_02265 [Palaeococcus pacificus DY20341]
MDEVLPPDLQKKREKGIDEYLSQGFDFVISHPKILAPFVPGILATLAYLVYIFKALPSVASLFRPTSEALIFFASKSFIFWSIVVALFVTISSLIGMVAIAYYLLKEADYNKAFKAGLGKLPIALLNLIVLIVLLMLPFGVLVFIKSIALIIIISLLISILAVPPIFFLPALIVEKSFVVLDVFIIYKNTFRDSIILGVLYSLISSAAQSLIPVAGSLLNFLIVLPAFTAVYAMLYEDWKEKDHKASEEVVY